MSLSLYRRLAPDRQTANMLNALHIALENRMTPTEAAGIAAAFADAQPSEMPVRPEFAGQVRKFATDQARYLATAGKPVPEPFIRRRLGHRMIFLSAGAQPVEKRTLILCFAGRSDRLNMPLPAFLQHLDASKTDVAVVLMPRRADPDAFRRGFGGLGEDLLSCIDALGDLLGLHSYRRTLAFGTSGGGLPAVMAGLRLRLPRVLASAPTDPFDPRWKATGGEAPPELLRRLFDALPAASRPVIDVTYAPNHPIDRAAAEAMGRILPIRHFHIRLDDGSRGVPHMVLGYAMLAGHLGAVLGKTLLQGDDAEVGA